MFLFPLCWLFSPFRLSAGVNILLWWCTGIFFVLIIGLRFDVGGDWGAYLEHYSNVVGLPLWEALLTNDPGYAALNWVSSLIDGGIFIVNLASAALVLWGVATFCRKQPEPWLGLLVATPYLLVVVTMGYTRQAIAVGFVMLAFSAMMDGKVWRYVFFCVIAALFHKSAIVLLLLSFFAPNRAGLSLYFYGTIVTVIAFTMILSDHYERLVRVYIEDGMDSEGGLIRVTMNALPALLFLLFRNKLSRSSHEKKFMSLVAFIAILLFLMVDFASTAVDRISLYFIPLQIFVFSRLHLLFKDVVNRTSVVIGVVVFYGSVQWVWLNYASHASYWLPYKFAPLAI